MADAQRWSVTYTKHVKQKRKVYQDGVLELQVSRRKVILFDEGDKLLESRFVKKDDVIKSGETVAFDAYLVDIGELCGCGKPVSASTCQEKDAKVTDKTQSSHGYDFQSYSTSVGRKPALGKVKGHKINLSPSENVIRDFRDSERKKYGSSPSSVDMSESSTTEWQVLYTTQLTQKAKKFHDGFLQLVVRGSLGRQVMLYDITRRTLESRFLKKQEIVCSGESLTFEGHLVEIGEQKGDQKAVSDSRRQEIPCKTIGKTDMTNLRAKLPTNKKFLAGKTPGKTFPGIFTNSNDSSSEVANAASSSGTTVNEPRRADTSSRPSSVTVELRLRSIHDNRFERLFHLDHLGRKPILTRDATMNKTSVAEQDESHAEECNGNAQKELRENNSDHDCEIRVSNPEIVEVLAVAEKCTAYEIERECQANSSSFSLSSGTTYGMTPIHNVECIDQNELISTPSVEAHSPVCSALDSENQKPIELAAFPRSNEVVEPEKCSEIFSDEENMTEMKAAETIGLSSPRFPKDCTKSMDACPSFDLGF